MIKTLFILIALLYVTLFSLTNISTNIYSEEKVRLLRIESDLLRNIKDTDERKLIYGKLIKLWQGEIKEVILKLLEITPTNCKSQLFITVKKWQEINMLEYQFLDKLYNGMVYKERANEVSVQVKLDVLKMRTFLMLEYLEVVYTRGLVLAEIELEQKKIDEAREKALKNISGQMMNEQNPYQ